MQYSLCGNSTNLADFFRNIGDEGGIVPFAAEGHGGHIGGVCFQKQPFQWDFPGCLDGMPGIFEGDRSIPGCCFEDRIGSGCWNPENSG